MEHKQVRLLIVAGILVIALMVAGLVAGVLWASDAVHEAAGADRVSRLELLLRVRPNQLNARDDSGHTPLHTAAWQGSLEALRFLIGRGADLTLADADGMTALHLAAYANHPEAVQALIDGGAAVNAVNATGMSALHLAAYANRVEAAQVLLNRGADMNIQDAEEQTPLHWAVEKKFRDLASRLIRRGADLNIRNRMGQRPLDLANILGDQEIGWLLVEHGARDYEDRGPLHIAAHRGMATLEHLIRRRTFGDINDTDRDGNTALHLTVRDTDSTLLLLQNGADPNRVNRDGQTPLHLAAIAGEPDVVDALVRRGADRERENYDRQTAMDLAERRNHYAVMQVLIDHGEEVRGRLSALHMASRDWNVGAVEALLARGLDVNVRDAAGRTPLHYAVSSPLVTSVLLENGADPNLANRQGQTPLHAALLEQHNDTARALIEGGADLQQADGQGAMPSEMTEDEDLRRMMQDQVAQP